MKSGVAPTAEEVARVARVAARFPGVTADVRTIAGATRALTEIHVLGVTLAVSTAAFEGLPGVEKVIRVRQRFQLISRHEGQGESLSFDYKGVRFSEDSFNVFAGLCAVDNRATLDRTFAALRDHGLVTARAGVYKPRTSPYDFQGLGGACLPFVFELAAKHGIRVIAMEVTREGHIDEIREALRATGTTTGVMLQVGARNAQNFELLKAIGEQQDFPVLLKRGMGITLEESFHAAEYVAAGGNTRIVLCLRGVKTHLGGPHRNLVDFAHVPVVRRMTRLLVCVDPSHAVGPKTHGTDGLLDLHQVTAQGVIAGASMVLVDVHPTPEQALCDGPQALTLQELPHFLADMALVRRAYEDRLRLHATHFGGR